MPLRLDLPDQVAVEGLRCVRVWIPNSDEYERALHSLLTYATKWFAWERDAAKRGKDAASLWRTAYVQTTEDFFAGLSCDCENDNGDTNDNGTAQVCQNCGGIVIMEESMGQVVTDIEYLSETGVLRVYYGKCCYTDIELSALEPNPPPNPVPFPETPDPIQTCGKASALIDCAYRMIDAGWDNKADYFGFEPAVRAAAGTNVTLSRAGIYVLRNELIALAAVSTKGDTLEADMVQEMKCLAVNGMNETTTGTEEEVSSILSSVKSAINNYRLSPIDGLTWTVWSTAFETIGYNDRLYLLSLGSDDDTADCTCPGSDGTEFWPQLEDWYIAYSFQGTHPSYWTLGTDNGNTIITARGAELQADTSGSEKVNLVWSPPVTTGTIKRIKVEMLINDNLVSGMWTGLGFQIADVGTNLQGQIIGTGGIYSWLDESVSAGVSNWYVTGELNANPVYDPMAIVISRIVLAGSGAHPLGL